MPLETQRTEGNSRVQAYGVLGNIMSLTGGFCSISCSLLVPIIIYMLLFRRRISRVVVSSLSVLLILGFGLLALTSFQNIMEIIQSTRTTKQPMGDMGLSSLLNSIVNRT